MVVLVKNLLGVLLAIFSSGVAARAAGSRVDESDRAASTAVARLAANDLEDLVAHFHEPQNYDNIRAAEDRRKIVVDLKLLLREFGSVSAVRVGFPPTYYRLEVAGGDIGYWSSLPNSGVAKTTTYVANFSKVGPGVISITLTEAGGKWEVRSVALGLEKRRRGSRATMLRIGRLFMAQVHPDISKAKIDNALETMLGP